jgi:metallo-beta-lactamase family protein
MLRPIQNEAAHSVACMDVILRRAGHILGSATVEVRTPGGTVGFSGDLGRQDHPLLCPPEPAPAVDAMVVESTYGDRLHPQRRLTSLGDPIRRAFDRGGVVLVPAFAIDRTPMLLMALKTLMRGGEVPTVPAFVDSPIALAALDVYRSAVTSHDQEVRVEVAADATDPFDPGDLRLAHTVDQSKRLNDPARPSIIISAAGMATGGRVVHHLAHLAPDPRNVILLPGFQVPGTRGHALLEGATALKMFGGYVPVRAEVVAVNSLSAHADANDLIAWLGTAATSPKTCYVVHGELTPANALADRIIKELGWCAVVPRPDEHILV